jgi:membrane protein
MRRFLKRVLTLLRTVPAGGPAGRVRAYDGRDDKRSDMSEIHNPAEGIGPDPRATPARRLHDFWRVVYHAGDMWDKDNAMRLSAAVAMYTLLALAPLLVMAMKVVGLFLTEEAAGREVNRQVRGFLGPRAGAAVEEMVAAAGKSEDGTWATLLSIGLLLFTASGVFVELRGALNAIWGLDPKRRRGIVGLVRERLLSFGLVLGVGFLLLVSQVLTTSVTSLSRYAFGEQGWASVVADLVSSTLVIALLFAVLYRFLPDARVGWRYVAAGGFVTAVLFKIGQYLLALYFAHIATQSVYGAAGSFVVVMLWVYYSSWILLYGAELIKAYAHLHGLDIWPTQDARKADVVHTDPSILGGVAK